MEYCNCHVCFSNCTFTSGIFDSVVKASDDPAQNTGAPSREGGEATSPPMTVRDLLALAVSMKDAGKPLMLPTDAAAQTSIKPH